MIRIAILLTILILGRLSAQDYQGKITYQSHRKVDLKLNEEKVNSEMQQQIQEMLKKQFQKEYELQFSSSQSVYKELKSLDKPSNVMGDVQVLITGNGNGDILYKNLKENRESHKREILGKVFLVKDSLKTYDWKLENESKKIGNYNCFKATFKKTLKTLVSKSINDTKEKETKENEKEVTVIAWYTPEIPIANGPAEYGGLPGLILELNDGSQTILCSKIFLNPKDGIEIKEPTKGKQVTRDEFKTIMSKKIEEMKSQVHRQGEGQSIEIKIGG